VQFAAVKSRQYAVVVAGVNGGSGVAQLNYHLDTSAPPVAPTLLQAPSLRTALPGSDVSLSAAVIGSAPLWYSWRKGALIAGATNASLRLQNVSSQHSGDYVLTVSNLVGAPLIVTVPLHAVVPPGMQWSRAPGLMIVSFPTVIGQRYIIEQANAVDGPWTPWTNSYPGDGGTLALTNFVGASTTFYRVRVE